MWVPLPYACSSHVPREVQENCCCHGMRGDPHDRRLSIIPSASELQSPFQREERAAAEPADNILWHAGEVSGVIAVVVMGLYGSATNKWHMSPR